MYATELRRLDVTFPSARTDALDETDPLSASFATATSALGDLERAVYARDAPRLAQRSRALSDALGELGLARARAACERVRACAADGDEPALGEAELLLAGLRAQLGAAQEWLAGFYAEHGVPDLAV